MIRPDCRALAEALARLVTEAPTRARHLTGAPTGAVSATAHDTTIDLADAGGAITDRAVWLDNLGTRGLERWPNLGTHLEGLAAGGTLHILTSAPAQGPGATYELLRTLREDCASLTDPQTPLRTRTNHQIRIADGTAAARAILADAGASTAEAEDRTHAASTTAERRHAIALGLWALETNDELENIEADTERLLALAADVGTLAHVKPGQEQSWYDGQPAPTDLDQSALGFQMEIYGADTRVRAPGTTIRWCGCIAGHADRRWGGGSDATSIRARAREALKLGRLRAQHLFTPGPDEIGGRMVTSLTPEEAACALDRVARGHADPWRTVLEPQLDALAEQAMALIERTGSVDSAALATNATP